MAKKEIFSVGFDFPGGNSKYIELNSMQSIADADIVIFNPSDLDFSANELYQGQPALSDHLSFKTKEIIDHWTTQIKKAFDGGKTIFIFLPSKKKAYVATGEQRFSGTGRNRVTERIVEPISNYDFFHIKGISFGVGEGSKTYQTKDTNLIFSLWEGFLKNCKYHVEIVEEEKTLTPLLVSRKGDCILGGVLRGKGVIILIPPILEKDSFVRFDKKIEDFVWTKEGNQVGGKLLKAIIEADKFLVPQSVQNPPPAWVEGNNFISQGEQKILLEKLTLQKEIKITEGKIDQRNKKLEQFFIRKGLLFEKGKPLEKAIIQTLQLMGFNAVGFDDGTHEFDVIFTSSEGRFLGEVEGRDNNPIAISKISQLIRNLHDDYGRDEVEKMAKGVIFGNPYRLLSLDKRKDNFTEKACASAKNNNIALIFTPDLFWISNYLSEKHDEKFAKACREAIIKASGEIVIFPPIPKGN